MKGRFTDGVGCLTFSRAIRLTKAYNLRNVKLRTPDLCSLALGVTLGVFIEVEALWIQIIPSRKSLNLP